jgi:hypothetical protein
MISSVLGVSISSLLSGESLDGSAAENVKEAALLSAFAAMDGQAQELVLLLAQMASGKAASPPKNAK